MNAKTEARVKAHGERLLRIFPNATPRDPVKLCKRLRRIETAANQDAERYANGELTSNAYACRAGDHMTHFLLIVGSGTDVPAFINSDPRGYALKIKSEYVAEHNLDIPRDWGGYGLIAPDLTA
jgi:hypothetical protein